MELTLAILLCLGGAVVGDEPELMCSDWQGKLISRGVEFYPKTEDPCFKCLCGEKGFATRCKTVSCAPPSCPMGYRTVSGKCCHFECTEAGDNSTGLTPAKTDVTGKASEDSLPDLGLRLVASTVSTFLILAVLLVLIHRLRQRRLLVALRRYGHRREHLDDSDNISYSPEYFGIQCPPYVDPPPPYTLPKPPYYPHGEQPPPYEEVVNNANDNLGNQLVNEENQIVTAQTMSVNNASDTRENNSTIHSANNSSTPNGVNLQSSQTGMNSSPARESRNRVMVSGREQSGLCNNSSDHSDGCITTDRHSGIVHFRNGNSNGGGQLNITMGIQNRGRNNRNRFSDSQFSVTHSRNAHTRNLNVNEINGLNLEIRNGFQNLRHNSNSIPLQPLRSQNSNSSPGENMSSTSTDIGESSTSAESLESSPNFSPDSPDIEGETTDRKKIHDIGDDADLTVKQFMDRQFGLSRVRRYPTTMSQSWTSAQLGSTGSPNFSHSVSLGSFLPNQESNRNNRDDNAITEGERSSHRNGSAFQESKNHDNQLLRSKSEQLKTNGSLKNPPFKGIVRSHTTTSNLPLPHTGFGARVSYVEQDELSRFLKEQRRAQSGDFSHLHHGLSSQDNIDSNVSDSSLTSANLSIRNLDPDKIIVTKRQDLLRELRLSHLLQHTDNHHMHQSTLPLTSMKVSNLDNNNKPRKHINKVGSEIQNTETAISNDAHYPDNSYRKTVRDSPLTNSRSEDTESDINVRPTVSDTSSLISTIESSKNSSPVKSVKHKVRELDNCASMSQSWHCHESDDNMSGWLPGTDTLGRNVNTNFNKKVVDKDVSNLFFPQFKPLYDVEPVQTKDLIPDSDMRASAAQMYNLETEERSSKKGKKKHLHKRHSAGCFPVKRDSTIPSHQASPSRPKSSHKLKNFSSKDRHAGHRYSDGLTDNIKVQNCDRRIKHSCDDEEPVVTDLTPPCLFHANMASSCQKVNQRENVGNCDNINERHSHYPPRNSKRRSKSLGRIENVRSPERKVESGRRQQSRKSQIFVGKSMILNDDIVLDRHNITESARHAPQGSTSQV